jgi:hypothetical protein
MFFLINYKKINLKLLDKLRLIIYPKSSNNRTVKANSQIQRARAVNYSPYYFIMTT